MENVPSADPREPSAAPLYPDPAAPPAPLGPMATPSAPAPDAEPAAETPPTGYAPPTHDAALLAGDAAATTCDAASSTHDAAPSTGSDGFWGAVRTSAVLALRRAPWGAIAREALAALVVVAAGAALGGPLGLLWRALAPRVEIIRTDGGWYPIQEEPEGYVADDGWFTIIGAGTGVLLAVAVWLLLRRWRGPAVLAALAVGSLLGALLAQWLGQRIGLAEYQQQLRDAAVGTRLHRPVKLRVDEVVLVQAILAVTVYTLLAAFHYDPSLQPGAPMGPYDDHEYDYGDGRHDEADAGAPDGGDPDGGNPVSSGSTVPRDPSGAPAPPVPGQAAPPPGAAGSALPAAG